MRTVLAVLVIAACGKSSPSSPPPPPPSPATGDAAAAAPVVDATPPADAPVALADAGTVDAAPIACAAQVIRQTRKEADALVKAGKPDDAIALLSRITCFLDEEQPEELNLQIAWALSDLTFAYYKAGNINACYGIAAGQLTPYHGNVGQIFAEDHAVMKALDYNAKLCQKAADKERGSFVDASACPFDENAFAIPNSGGSCLAFEPGKQDEDELNVCGPVVIKRQDKSKPLRTVLEVEDGNLADGSVCCNVQSVGFGKRAGASWAVLVHTLGRDCNGGTAASEEQHVYALVGTKLELVHSLRSVAH